jgi:YHS domain-containing protein
MNFKIYLALVIFIAAFNFGRAQESEIFAPDKKAIKGYDPVDYFTKGEPTKGLQANKLSFAGADWYFSSNENLTLFKANPLKYMPQYGGYCAFGLAGGYKAPTSPTAWTIVNGRLYLNYSLKVQKDWSADQAEMISKADKNWPSVKSKK